MSYKQNKIQKIIENKERQKKLAQNNKRENIVQTPTTIQSKPIEKKQSPKKTKSTSKHLKKYNDKEIDDNMMSAFTATENCTNNNANTNDNFM